MNKKPIIAGVALIAVLAGAATGVYMYKRHQIEASKKAPFEPIMSVEVVKAEKTTWYPTARLVGTVVAKRSVMVSNEVVGAVKDVRFESGDEVQAGQVLLTLDDASEQADLAAAKAAQEVASRSVEVSKSDLVVAQSNLELAKSNQQRYSTASNTVSAAELDRVNADLRKATADIDRAKSGISKAMAEVDQAAARVAQIQTTIDKKTIKAPFRARASMRTVHPGQYLAEGTSIVGLAELTDDIYLDFAIPQEYVSRVVPGAVVLAQSEVLGPDLKLTVLSMDSVVNPTTRNIRVRSSVPDPTHKLKQGMFIDVVVPIEAPKEYTMIPGTAVRRAAFGAHVFVIVPNDPAKNIPGMPPLSVAKTRMVELGENVGGNVLVLKGLEPGEEIASGGSFKLFEGVKVMKVPPGGAAPGGPGGKPEDKPVAAK